jgi:hypothetical protein
VKNVADIGMARAAKVKAISVFSLLANVNGVGITRVGEGYGLKVNLAEHPPEGVELPKEVDGVPIVVKFVGQIAKRELQSHKTS